jgi:nitrous oxide reductase accessory protein NosL
MFEDGAADYRVRPNEISLLNFITYVIAFVRKQPRAIMHVYLTDPRVGTSFSDWRRPATKDWMPCRAAA